MHGYSEFLRLCWSIPVDCEIYPRRAFSEHLPMQRSTQHVGFLDQLRGLAILSVLMVHIASVVCGHSTLPWHTWHADFSNASGTTLWFFPFMYGWAGVAIFFVVSGFCIHLSFAQNPNWRAFFMRRFFRIYPPYLFAVCLFALFIPWTRVGHTFFHKIFQIGTHLALVNNFDDATFGGINPNFWSIAVEAQLYLLYPLLLFIISKVGWKKGLISLAVLEFGIRQIVYWFPTLNGTVPLGWWQGLPVSHCWFLGFPLMYWFSWSIGAMVADAHLKGQPIPFANHSLLFWSAMAFGSYLIKYLACFSFTFSRF